VRNHLSKKVIMDGIKAFYPTEFMDELAHLDGVSTYVYGGIPRDLIMGRKWKDVDLRIIIDGDWDAREERLDNFFEDRADVQLKLRYYDLDGGFTLYRILPHGSSVDMCIDCSVTYAMDACPPDYTVSGVYVHLKDGKIVDPYNGIEDISSRLVRPAKPFEHLVSGDPLSPFAAAKLAVKLDFKIDESFKTFIAGNSHHVRQIFDYIRLNGRAFRNEVMLAKLFDGFRYDPSRYCQLLDELHLLRELVQYLEAFMDEDLCSEWKLEDIEFHSEKGFENSLSHFLSAMARCFLAEDYGLVFEKIKALLTLDLEKTYGEFYVHTNTVTYKDRPEHLV